MALSRRRWLSLTTLFVSLAVAGPAAAQPSTAFDLDVDAAIDDGLAYLRVQSALTGDGADEDNARGLALLAFLERGGGYSDLDEADRAGARDAVQRILDGAACGVSRGFYAYCHGHSAMALSLYARTGGPEIANAGGHSLRAALDKMVADTLGAQSTSGQTSGFWGYTGPAGDSSTTQFAAAGLAASRGYYLAVGDAAARQQVDQIDVALIRTAEGYARQRNADGGIGYGVGGDASTYQQTASGLWSQLLGGFALGHPSVQAYLGWQRDRYNYETIDAARASWRQSYLYYMWSSAKAYRLLEASGAAPAAGELSPADLGAAAPSGPRLSRREPMTDVRPAPRGPGGAGFYADTEAGWFYDYAYALMAQQEANGRFSATSGGIAHGCWNSYACQSYALLVLERSLGGACVDADGDGVCDEDDNCDRNVNPDQADADGDGAGDPCDACPGENDSESVRFGDDVVCPSTCAGNRPPVVACAEALHVPVDDACGWRAEALALADTVSDPDGHRMICGDGPREGVGLAVVPAPISCTDECGAHSPHHCETPIVPRDETAPVVTVGRSLSSVPLADDWTYNWHNLVETCELTWTDNCTPSGVARIGIVGVESSDPAEVIDGEPGFFYSADIAVDWAGFMVNLDGHRAGPRTYTFDFTVGDGSGNWTAVECQFAVEAGPDATCDGLDDDGDGLVDEDYIAPWTPCGVGACERLGHVACVEGATVTVCEPGAAEAEHCNDLDDDCDGEIDEGGVCDVTPPEVQIDASADVVAPGTPIEVTVTAEDASGSEITRLEVSVDGVPVALDVDGRFTLTLDAPSFAIVTAEAEDAAGNVGTATRALRAAAAGDSTSPLAAITAPNVGDETAAPMSITGTAADENLVGYRLSYSPAHLDTWIPLAERDAPVVDGVLGEWPAHRLPANVYDLRLEAWDADGELSVVDRRVVVPPSPRLGVYVTCEQDMEVDLLGTAISIRRCWNAGRAADEGMGHGWTLGAGRGHVAHDRPLADGWRFDEICTQEVGGACVEATCTVASTSGHRTWVYLDRGDEEAAYALEPEIVDTVWSAGQCAGRIQWVPVDDTPTTWALIHRDGDEVQLRSGETRLEAAAGGDFAATAFDLWLPAGRIYGIDDRRIEYLAGDDGAPFVEFTGDAIESVGGARIELRRDAADRIEAIVEPSGATMAYAYDADGDLVSVTDRAGAVTTYGYVDHRLTARTNATGGLNAIEYGNDGRWAAARRPGAAPIETSYDLVERRETWTVGGEPVSSWQYDARGRVVEHVDARGRTTAYDYAAEPGLDTRTLTRSDGAGAVTRFVQDAAGRPLRVEGPDGETRAVTYDADGRLATLEDARGLVLQIDTNDAGQIEAVRGPGGESLLSMTFDADGRLATSTDVHGASTSKTYDDDGRLATWTGPDGGQWTLAYDDRGLVVGETDPEGTRWSFTYDAEGRPTSTADPVGGEVTYEWDEAGQLVAVIDPMGGRLSRTYDEATRVETVTGADGAVLRATLDDLDRPVVLTDPEGRSTRIEYDAAGRPVRRILPDGAIQTTAYDEVGRVVARTDGEGHQQRIERDPGGRATLIIRPDGTEIELVRDAAGAIVRAIDAGADVYDLEYDAFGRLTRFELPGERVITHVRDADGRRIRRTDPEDRAVELVPGADGRIRRIAAGADFGLDLAYDARGAVASIINDLGREWTRTVDARGLVTERSRPDGATDRFTYDAAGRLSQLTAAGGAVVDFARDAVGRLTGITGSDGLSYEIEHTPSGRTSLIRDATGETTHTYDARGRLSAIRRPGGGHVEYTYDAADNVTELVVGGAEDDDVFVTRYVYDAADRPIRIIDDTGVTFVAYDAAGREIRTDYPNGTWTLREYDVRGPSRIAHFAADGTTVDEYLMARDRSGKITRLERGSVTVEYTYDGAGRLVGEAITEGGETRTVAYTYDEASNLIAVDDSLEGLTTYEYDSSDRLVLVRSSDPSEHAYAYDADGRLTRHTGPDGDTIYGYDSLGRLITVTEPSGDQWRYRYDHAGQRTGIVAPDGTERTILLGLAGLAGRLPTVLAELDAAGAVQRRHVHGLRPILSVGDGAMRVVHTDHRESVRVTTDDRGALADAFDFGAFGELTVRRGDPRSARFAGHVVDPTGLVHMRARFYSPQLARFITPDRQTPDIEEPLGFHRYLYALGDPINVIDPTGDIPILAVFAVRAIVGYTLAYMFDRVVIQGPDRVRDALNDRGITPDHFHDWLDDVETNYRDPNVQQGEPDEQLCHALRNLLELDAKKGHDPFEVLATPGYHAATFANLSDASYVADFNTRSAKNTYRTIYGPVDLDWAIRSAGAFGSNLDPDELRNPRSAIYRTTRVYGSAKAFWNSVGVIAGNRSSIWDNIAEQNNLNAPVVAAAWLSGHGTLPEIMRPSIESCIDEHGMDNMKPYLPTVPREPTQEEIVCAPESAVDNINGYNGCILLTHDQYGYSTSSRNAYVVLLRTGPWSFINGELDDATRTWRIGGETGWVGVNNCTQDKWRPFNSYGYWPSLFRKAFPCR